MQRILLTLTVILSLIVGMALATSHAFSSADRRFALEAAHYNAFELQAAILAQTMGTSPEVKTYAEMILIHHKTVGTALQAAVKKSDPSLMLPSEPSPKYRAVLEALKNSGMEFNAKYKAQMVSSHVEIHAFFARYLARRSANIDTWAVINTAQPIVVMHLEAARKLPAQ